MLIGPAEVPGSRHRIETSQPHQSMRVQLKARIAVGVPSWYELMGGYSSQGPKQAMPVGQEAAAPLLSQGLGCV